MSNFKRYRALIAIHGMTQRGAAKFLDIGERTSRRWATGDIEVPLAVMMLLELMTAYKIDAVAARKAVGRKAEDYSDQRLPQDE